MLIQLCSAIIPFLIPYYLSHRKKEQRENPEAVVNSLKTYQKSIKRRPSTAKFMVLATTIRESDEILDSAEEDRVSVDSEKLPVDANKNKSLPDTNDTVDSIKTNNSTQHSVSSLLLMFFQLLSFNCKICASVS